MDTQMNTHTGSCSGNPCLGNVLGRPRARGPGMARQPRLNPDSLVLIRASKQAFLV
jgi:hypothetical protein